MIPKHKYLQVGSGRLGDKSCHRSQEPEVGRAVRKKI